MKHARYVWLFFLTLLPQLFFAQTNDTSRILITRKYVPDPARPQDSVLISEIIRDNVHHTISEHTFYTNGKMARESERSMRNDQENVKTYYESGALKEKGTFRTARWIGDYTSYFDSGTCKERALHFDFSGQRDSLQIYYWKNSCNVPEWKFFFRHGREIYYEHFDRRGNLLRSDSIHGQPKADKDPEYFLQYTGGKKLVVQDPWIMDSTAHPLTYKKRTPFYVPPGGTHPFSGTGNWVYCNSNGQVEKKGYFVNFKLKEGEVREYNTKGQLVRVKLFQDFRYICDAPLPTGG